ncbi:MAG: hypothetical protein U1A78_35135 [Polyangia bacterium]
MTARTQWNRGLLTVLACAGLWGAGCRSLPQAGDRASQGYLVEVRCHTPEGVPIANVRIANPESGASGLTDARGLLSFRLEGHEGTEVSLKVESLPDGIVLVDESAPQRLILKSIAAPSAAPGSSPPAVAERRGPLIHDILLRKNKETYVILVSTDGVPNVPVKANGVRIGRLNSRGAGAFRLQGQPGEELKVVLDDSSGEVSYTGGTYQQTFTLPPSSAILSFHSNITLLADNTVTTEPQRPVITFEDRKHKRSHGGHHRRHRSKPEPVAAPVTPEKPKGPVQVPFRDIDLQKR